MITPWLWIEHGPNKSWTRALVPSGITSAPDLVRYIQRGGRVDSNWIELPDRARFTPRVVGTDVIATIVEPKE